MIKMNGQRTNSVLQSLFGSIATLESAGQAYACLCKIILPCEKKFFHSKPSMSTCRDGSNDSKEDSCEVLSRWGLRLLMRLSREWRLRCKSGSFIVVDVDRL